jgi:hypothetical protein
VKVRAIGDSCQHGGVRRLASSLPCTALATLSRPTGQKEKTKMKSNAIGAMKKGEKGLRPSGDRPGELVSPLFATNCLPPGVGYVEKFSF